MQIYYITAQAPRRVCALAKHLGIEADFIDMGFKGDLKTPGYKAINPNLSAPTLVDGDTVIWEATAISAYLCIKAGSDMWPATNPAEQVEVMRWLSWNAFHWSRAVGQFYFEFMIKPIVGLPGPDRKLLQELAPKVLTHADVLEAHLRGRSFVALDRLTIADFALGSMVAEWEKQELPFGDYPAIQAWNAQLVSIPAWRDPWPAKSRKFHEASAALTA